MSRKTTDYWNRYYLENIPQVPSQFGAFVLNEFFSFDNFIDIGCGDGRDSWFFHSHGKTVTAVDGSESVIQRNTKTLREQAAQRIRFACVDFNDPDAVAGFTADLEFDRPSVVYARFFLHAIDDRAEKLFFQFCDRVLESEGRLCLEYRTLQDRDLPKTTDLHHRRFIDPDQTKQRLGAINMKLIYSCQGQGYAKHGQDDAVICRQIFARDYG